MSDRSFPRLLAGVAIGAVLTYGLTATLRRSEDAQVEALLKLSDAELVARAEELKSLEGASGKVFLALLACIGHRATLDASISNGGGRGVRSSPDSADPADSASPGPGTSVVRSGSPSGRDSPPTSEAPAPTRGPSLGGASSATHDFDFHRFYCQAARGQPTAVSTEGWLARFPEPGPRAPGIRPDAALAPDPLPPRARGLGGRRNPAEAFLTQRACAAPLLWRLGPQARQRSRFFESIRGRVFEGRTYPLPAAGRESAARPAPLRMHFHSNPSRSASEREYWASYQYEGRQTDDVLESRYTVYSGTEESHDAIRYNACSQSISILGDSCPWGGAFDLELKDLFFSVPNSALLVNHYCRERTSGRWTRVATSYLTDRPNSG